jgi:hypothetical protein
MDHVRSAVTKGHVPMYHPNFLRYRNYPRGNMAKHQNENQRKKKPPPEMGTLGTNFKWLTKDEKEFLVARLADKYQGLHVGLLPFVKVEDILDTAITPNMKLLPGISLLFRVNRKWFFIFVLVLPIVLAVELWNKIKKFKYPRW